MSSNNNSSTTSSTTEWNPAAQGWVPREHRPPQKKQQQQGPQVCQFHWHRPVQGGVALPIINKERDPLCSSCPPDPNATRYPNPLGPCPRRACSYFPSLEREECGSRTFDREPEVRHIWTSGLVNNYFHTHFTFLSNSFLFFIVLPLHLP